MPVNPIDMMRYGHADIDRALARLRPDDWTAIALGVWTTKDLVGHLGAFEVRFADVLAGFAGESTESDLLSANPATFNDDQAAIRRDWPVAQVLGELADAHARVMRLAGRIESDLWREVGTIPWYGPQYALEELLVYQVYGHKREHKPQLEAVLDRPGR